MKKILILIIVCVFSSANKNEVNNKYNNFSFNKEKNIILQNINNDINNTKIISNKLKESLNKKYVFDINKTLTKKYDELKEKVKKDLNKYKEISNNPEEFIVSKLDEKILGKSWSGIPVAKQTADIQNSLFNLTSYNNKTLSGIPSIIYSFVFTFKESIHQIKIINNLSVLIIKSELLKGKNLTILNKLYLYMIEFKKRKKGKK